MISLLHIDPADKEAAFPFSNSLPRCPPCTGICRVPMLDPVFDLVSHFRRILDRRTRQLQPHFPLFLSTRSRPSSTRASADVPSCTPRMRSRSHFGRGTRIVVLISDTSGFGLGISSLSWLVRCEWRECSHSSSLAVCLSCR
jgi:hypothetical protein